ncbi:MAG TPA: 5'/3'-nucleotidase SurE [bacterium]|nr:5'/3'-nucleotidase SurE [bacterium]HPN44781.1 5'/3'-nucleotidase SurE [bacterium]
MRILLTNDDGISAPGLAALAKEINKIGQVLIVAPETEMSAVGHAITLHDPLRVSDYAKNGSYFGKAVSGTPADCVKIAWGALYKNEPKIDLLISGINQGSNTGINTIYSGTVSAATEGAILGIPSFAISLTTYTNPDFSYAARFARYLAEKIMINKLPRGVFLNVNVPAVPEEQIAGAKITRQGMANYCEEFQVRKDPREREYYWLTGDKEAIEEDESVDDRAILQNKVSITPIHYDLTFYPFMRELEKWHIDFNSRIE